MTFARSIRLIPALAVGLCLAVTPPAVAEEKSLTLADALRIIQSRELVDLTHSFGPLTPVWGGFGQATMSAACDPKTHRPFTIEQDGFRTIFYSLVGQYGTHVDPPAHFRADGMTMDEIPLKDMILPLVVFDITPLLPRDPNHALSVDDIKVWEKEHGRIPAGSFAALRTDMSKDWDSHPERFKHNPFGLVAGRDQVPLRRAQGDGHRPRVARHGHVGVDGLRDLDPQAESLPDRGDGQPGQGAPDRRGHRRDLAEGGPRLRIPGTGVCDPAVSDAAVGSRGSGGREVTR